MRIFFTGLMIMSGMLVMAQDTTSKERKTGTLSLSGYAEGYYSYDFNKPVDNNKPGFIYSHNRHNEFTINLAMIKAGYSAERVRANIALAAGTYMNANYIAEPGSLKNVYEANVGYKLTRNKELWLDIGILPSHIGFESAIGKDCWIVTRSILADNSPYFESGVKLTYTTDNGKWLFSGLALNGWQRIQRVSGNSLMSWGTQVLYKPDERISLNYSTFLGTDKPDSARLYRTFHNIYGIFQLNSRWGLTAGFDIGTEESPVWDNTNIWYAPVGIVRFTPVDQWSIAFRYEYYSDEDGVIIPTGTSNGFKTTGLSLNLDYIPVKNLFLRMEFRNLNSKDRIFTDSKGNASRYCSFITFSTAIAFNE